MITFTHGRYILIMLGRLTDDGRQIAWPVSAAWPSERPEFFNTVGEAWAWATSHDFKHAEVWDIQNSCIYKEG